MSVAPPVLSGRHVRLRVVYPTDYEYLYTLATHESLGWRLRYRGITPSPDNFASLLWQNVIAQFVVERIDGGQRIGHVQAFNASERDAWCHVAITLDPAVGGAGWPLEALVLFLDYVFTMWNFRKVYAEIAEYNYDELASGAEKVFTVEGRLAEHLFYDGRYWDTVVVAVYREDFMREWHPRVEALSSPPPSSS